MPRPLVPLLGAAASVNAAVFTTFVAGGGQDTGDCSTPSTARWQITYAITQTIAGGNVRCWRGDYNPFSGGEAVKQVDIIGQGGGATITGSILGDPRRGALSAAIIVNVNSDGHMPIHVHGLTIAAGGGGILILGNSPEVAIRKTS